MFIEKTKCFNPRLTPTESHVYQNINFLQTFESFGFITTKQRLFLKYRPCETYMIHNL